jgi:hypothetical protein
VHVILPRRNTHVLVLLFSGLIIAWSMSGPSQVQAEDAMKLYPVNEGQLKLQVPAGWVDEVQGSLTAGPFTLTLRPAQGNRFLVRWAVSWDEKAGAGFNAPGRLQEIVLAAGSQFMPHAAEKQLILHEFKGGASHGYYLPLTVKAPQTGGYEIMTQGAAALEGLMIVFTYQGHTGGDADFGHLIEIIRGARVVKAQSRR